MSGELPPPEERLAEAVRQRAARRREAGGRSGYCAVRNGILTVSGGKDVAVATREAHVSDDLDELEGMVLAGYRQHRDAERSSRTASAKLRMQAIRHMVESLRGGSGDIDL